MKKIHSKQQGFVVILAIVVMAVLMTMSASVWGYTALQVKSSRQAVERSQVLHIAEAGIDKALHELNTNSSFSGENNISVGNGEYTTTVTTIDSNNKEIISTAYYPNEANAEQQVTVKTRVTIDLSTVAFNFGVQVGEGGLVMNNNAEVIGNVYSNGNISGWAATINGDATVAGAGSPTVDQECAISNGDFNMNVNANRDVAQRFTPSVSGNLSKIQVYLKKTGSPSNINVKILRDNGSGTNPIENQVGGNGTLSSSLVTNNYGWIDVTFSSPPSLSAGTNYWLLLDTSSSSSNYYSWATASNDSCSDGTGKHVSSWSQGNNPAYTAINKDLNFRTYMGGGTPTSISSITVTGDARAPVLTGWGCTIGGDAYYDTTNDCATGGTSHPGTTDSPQQAMPISQAQINQWRSQAENGGVHNGDLNIWGGNTDTRGPLKIDGSLTLSNGAVLYVTGPLWVTGNINLSNNSEVRLAASLGNNSSVIMAGNPSNPSNTGSITISNNAQFLGNGNPGSFPLVVSTKEGNGAINLSNNTAGAIYYASDGWINVANNAGASQLTGYGINMSNNSTITYNSGLADVSFSSGPGGSWAIVKGSYVIIWQ